MDFLFEQAPFHAFGQAHFIPLGLVALIGLSVILFANNKLDQDRQYQLIFYLSLIPCLGYAFNVIFPLIEGDFNVKDDLPIHLCRFLAVTSPLVIKYRNRYWIGIFYFWILAGTLNANITPDVEFAFPHWTYFNYWMVHSFLIIIPIYYVAVLKLKISFKDLKNAFWMANAFLIFTLIVNVILGSNYMYSLNKPVSASILDYMGPWPVYLLVGQLLALVLFLILYIPFALAKFKLR